MGLVVPRHVGSSWTRDQTRVPCMGRQILNHCATSEVPSVIFKGIKISGFLKGRRWPGSGSGVLDLYYWAGPQVSVCEGDAICLAFWGLHRIQGIHMGERTLKKDILRGSSLNAKAEAWPQTHLLAGCSGRCRGQDTAGAAGIT